MAYLPDVTVSSSVSTLIELLECGKTADFKSLASKIRIPQKSKILQSVLLRTAIKCSNIEALTFLFGSGSAVETQNLLGETPLHCALRHKQFQAVVHLLFLDADPFAQNFLGETALQICLREKSQAPDYVITCLLDRLKKTNFTARETAKHLERSGCTLRQALLMQDAEVMSYMLDSRDFIDEDESRALLEMSMNSGYLDNVKTLLYYGPGADSRKRIFWDRVIHYMWHPSMYAYFDKLVEWEVIDTECLSLIIDTFAFERADVLQIFLNIGVDEYINAEFGVDVKMYLFSNNRVSDDLQWLMKNTYFDVNCQDHVGASALHLAAWSRNVEGVYYLLSHGADPNLEDSMGRTPLMCARDEVTFAMLMDYGGDLRVLDDVPSLGDPTELHLLAAPYYILHKDTPVDEQIREYVDLGIDDLDAVEYEQYLCLRDLEWMNTIVVDRSVTLYTCLLEKTEFLAGYVKSEEAVSMILDFVDGQESKVNYAFRTILENNMMSAVEMNGLKREAAGFLCDVMGLAGTDHLVIEHIVGYLSHQDLLVFEGMYM